MKLLYFGVTYIGNISITHFPFLLFGIYVQEKLKCTVIINYPKYNTRFSESIGNANKMPNISDIEGSNW